MTIEFILKQESYDERDTFVRVTTRSEELGAVVEAFKEFLRHAGYHAASIERVLYVAGDSQGFAQGDGNPRQGDFFSIDDDTDAEPDAGDLFT